MQGGHLEKMDTTGDYNRKQIREDSERQISYFSYL